MIHEQIVLLSLLFSIN